MLRSHLFDFSDAYIVVKKLLLLQIQIMMRMTKDTFKKIAPFASCISKINNILTDNAEDLDID